VQALKPPPPPAPAAPPRPIEPDIPLRPRAGATPPAPPAPPSAKPAPPPAKKKPGGLDIDLTDVLSQLQSAPEASLTVHQNLDEVFDTRRSQLSRQEGVQKAAEQLALARTYLDMGMNDEAIAALTNASKIPTHRFEAASLLGRLYLKKQDPAKAVEWLERAAQAPAPTAEAGAELLYDLGATLESSGETARALAVFLELQADAGEYKDVAERVDRLARVQTGG
jgi:tetratricopeptide (TPR) repeat protein